MTIKLVPISLPPTADASKFTDIGREVRGVDPGSLSTESFEQIRDALYKLTPEQQYALTKAFDPESENYGHGNNKTESTKKSILHPDLKTIPRVPQVQLIGNGTVYNHEGLAEAMLKHPSHTTIHKTRVTPEDEAKGITRFYRWHIDAALYDLSPPKVTSLYGIHVPKGDHQICHYDDGTGDELEVPLGTTAFVSGKTMFNILPKELESLAVRSKVRYAPHPYVWMAPAHALPIGLGIENEGLELPLSELPPWEEARRKTLPVVWKNSVTGNLHFQVHPCGAAELIVDPLPAGASKEGALYPDGVHSTDLKEVRDLLCKMQGPAIAPKEIVFYINCLDQSIVILLNAGVCGTVFHQARGAIISAGCLDTT
ncbi:hypothetical protein F5880DRAFT_1652892 [Lentinula raphanica]|nr:hypothetical protein F5880DRAFT_1652892 [Lentinula raphanica]